MCLLKTNKNANKQPRSRGCPGRINEINITKTQNEKKRK